MHKFTKEVLLFIEIKFSEWCRLLLTDFLLISALLATLAIFFQVGEMLRKASSFLTSKPESYRDNAFNSEVPISPSRSLTSNETFKRVNSRTLPPIAESWNMEKQYPVIRGFDAHFESDDLDGYVDDLDETSPKSENVISHPSPDWIDGPRDITTLPQIIHSTYSDFGEEADYAMKQMLAILESLHPLDEHLHLLEDALKAIEHRLPQISYKENGSADWPVVLHNLLEAKEDPLRIEDPLRKLSVVQMTAVFDALPFLFETVASFDKLQKYQNVLSMMIVLALGGNSMICRQCISAITILTERNLLTQDFLRFCAIPGLFNVYKAGIGAFHSNDLRTETVQALCQMITYETIHDRNWIFHNFIPKFSIMLKDTAMHVRKSSLLIFGSLGNLFGEKFTELFLIPHLISLSYDLNWAVRKAACEIFVKVANCSPAYVRGTVLTTVFVRLLNDPNKWVSFVAYQHLGAFIALFANPDITGLEMRNGEVVVRPEDENVTASSDTSLNESGQLEGNTSANEASEHGSSTVVLDRKSPELRGFDFETLPEGTYLPSDGESEEPPPITKAPDISISKTVSAPPSATANVRTPKRGERVMGSVLSGLNKMLSFDRISSPKAASPSEKKPGLSLQGAITLMDKWSQRNSPTANQQRFTAFTEYTLGPDGVLQEMTEKSTDSFVGNGIAAKCSSSDDLSKLGLEDDEEKDAASRIKKDDVKPKPSPRKVRPFSVRERLFLRRLGALPSSPKSPKRSPKKSISKRIHPIFQFNKSDDKENVEDVNEGREQYMATALPRFNDDDESLDQSFMIGDDDDDDDVQPKKAKSPEAATKTEEPVPNEFSLTYWSADGAIDCSEDELEPFGSSSDSPTSISYLENRLDVMKIHSPRARSISFGSHNTSPLRGSPRRNTVSSGGSPKALSSDDGPMNLTLVNPMASVSLAQVNAEEMLKLNIFDDFGEMEMSMSSSSSVQGGGPASEEANTSMTASEAAVFEHVPQALVDSYMCVMGNVANIDPTLISEIHRHCAFNFPAVCYTLGRAGWPSLKYVFAKLAADEQVRVRQSISYSIHEIARMLGTEITDNDLLPFFYDLRNDPSMDVRSGILAHLFDFVECLSPEKRSEMILSLPQFFPIGAQPGNQAQNGDWRSRYELISQLAKLCSLYSIEDVNVHMSGIALTLADDRVAEVRREAVILVATIVGALVRSEWEKVKANRKLEKGHIGLKNMKSAGIDPGTAYLSEKFIDDIVLSFANTQKWTRRQTFCFICAQVLKDSHCNGVQFRYFFVAPLQKLATDKVANVRLAACEAISIWKSTLLGKISSGYEEEGSTSLSDARRADLLLVSEAMSVLVEDEDVDAAFMAKKCQGWANDADEVDVKSRTKRMRQRELEFFGDLILTDDDGKIVRVSQDLNTIAVIKSAPIVKMEEVDEGTKVLDEYQNKSNGEEVLQTPPMICAAVQSIDITEEVDMELDSFTEEQNDSLDIRLVSDNTEIVDMEIDEPEEDQHEGKTKIMEKDINTNGKEEETEIPMDPSPTKIEISATSPGESEA